MKQHILTVAAAALLSIPTFSIAEDKPAGDKPAGDKPAGERGGPGGPGGRGGARMNPEERMKFMTEKLSLTQEQQDKIKAIYAKSADANKALREKGFQNLSEEEKKQMNESRKAQQEEVNAVLTPEQKEKMKELFQQGRRGGGGRPDGEKPKN
jgi:Spy/CpxP family protein refolding chaperone